MLLEQLDLFPSPVSPVRCSVASSKALRLAELGRVAASGARMRESFMQLAETAHPESVEGDLHWISDLNIGRDLFQFLQNIQRNYLFQSPCVPSFKLPIRR